MEELGTRRDSLTGLTPAELASSISHMLAVSEKRLYTSEEDRVMTAWEGGLELVDGLGGMGGACGGEVDERKVQALLELDLDIDLDL